MKKIFTLIVSVFAASMFLTSCDPTDFGDINKDPNKPSTSFTTYFFTDACRYANRFAYTTATNAYDPWLQEWAGYLSESKNNQYGPLSTTSYYSCSSIYLNPLKNLHKIIEMNEDPEQKDQTYVAILGTSGNQIAAAKTLMSYYFMSISDINGPVIITDAFKGASEDNWTPKYDTQQEAYTILDNTLKEAYAQFDESGTLDGSADVLYGGDIKKWKKFNASLRMLLAIKLSDVDPNTGKTRFAAAYADGGMTDAADGLDFTYDDLNWNMMYYWCSPDYSSAGLNPVPNYFIVETMKELKDNRMFKYFDVECYKGKRDPEIFPRDQYSSFYGAPFGLVSNEAVSKWSDCVSCINYSMLGQSATVPIIPAARILLTEAEAAYRGWINADPKTLYEAGIKASFAWWGATGADAYVKSDAVAYNPDNGLEQIAIQRWIAGYLADGVQAWSDWRRLDIPKMPVGPGASNTGTTHYPYRLPFYDTDRDYNKENYQAAIATLQPNGKDDKDNRVWWDVAPNWEGVLTDEQCTPSVQLPAKWEVWKTGTMTYGFYYYSGEPLYEGHKTTIYQDVNHPGEYKISPYANGGELLITLNSADNSFTYPSQIVAEGVRVGDWDSDQGTDHSDDPSYRGYFDSDEGAWLFMSIWRTLDDEGKWAITCYGYDAFIPDSE